MQIPDIPAKKLAANGWMGFGVADGAEGVNYSREELIENIGKSEERDWYKMKNKLCNGHYAGSNELELGALSEKEL